MSFPTAAQLANHEGLVPWLAEGTWRSHFEPRALARPHALSVATIHLREDDPDYGEIDADCEVLIEAQVKGDAPRPYRTRVFVFSEYDGDTRTMAREMEMECSCGSGFVCQHIVAVFETLQATDRAHRIGQTKPVFVHKLVCCGTIEDRILDLQQHKSALVEALLSEDTGKLKIDAETLSHLLSPLG